jgi:hypothetical protein
MKMKQNKNMIKTVAIFLLGTTIFFTACKKETMSSSAPIPGKNKIAYIYKSDSTDGSAFKTILEANNSVVTLIDRSVAATTNYSSYNLIVIDNNADTLHATPVTGWSTADTAAIKGSGKPILLMGLGGLQFGEKLNNNVRWGNTSAGYLTTSFKVMDSTSKVYKTPKLISIPSNNQLDIYSSPVISAGEYSPAIPLYNDVVLMGGYAIYPNYYPVCFEKGRYGAFGFYGKINTMTNAGKDFMVNLAFYVGNLAQ